MSYRLPFVVGGISAGLCAVSFLGLGLYAEWDSPRLINFLGAWIPFVLSILLAFVPSAKDMKYEWIKWLWRSSVVVVGFLWSVMLWHQQDLTDKQNAKLLSNAINGAVTSANTHSDGKFADVQRRVDGLGRELNQTATAIGEQLGQMEKRLDSNIGRVGKPEPPEHPKFTFSFWRDGMTESDFPLTSEFLSPEADGNFKVRFAIRNDSSVFAEGIEEWVQICDGCAFAAEPKNFDKPDGSDNRVRHRVIPAVNGGVTVVEGNEFEVKPPNPFVNFSMVFKVTCRTCGPVQITKEYWVIPGSPITQQ